MDSSPSQVVDSVRYEPDENPPRSLAIALALQFSALVVGAIVLTVAIVFRAAGMDEGYVAWGAFAALLISGAVTIVQVLRVGPFGAGYILCMGTSGAFIAVSVAALQQGGAGLLASLVIGSSVFQFILARRLSLLRRILTPTVGGTVIMLISVTVMPLLFDFLDDLPEGSPLLAGQVAALVTLVVTFVVVLLGKGPVRLFGPIAGIIAGCIASWFLDILRFEALFAASWIGAPVASWPGLSLDFGPAFWVLLPGFTLVTLVGAIETIGDAVGIQRVSWRKPRATDYRAVQGAVTADGLGNLLSGLLSTVPNTTYSSSVSVTEVTGIASRRVGVWIGAIFCALAFLPKFTQLLLAIPQPVIGAYAIAIISLLFMLGTRIVVQDGMDYRKATIVGFSFWFGVGCQYGQIPLDGLPSVLQELLSNGMTAGGMAALGLTAFGELAGRKRARMRTPLAMEALPRIQRFLEDFGRRGKLSDETARRVALAAEETLLLLVSNTEGDSDGASDAAAEDGAPATAPRRLLLTARRDGSSTELEFLAAGGEGNIEDHMAVIGAQMDPDPVSDEFSLRILRHLAASVQHHKYADTDVVTVRVADLAGTASS